MKNVTTHIIALLVGLVIAYLYNFGIAYNIYGLFQSKSISEFSDAELTKFILYVFWFISACFIVYGIILFNCSWKNKFIKKSLKGWKKHIANIIANLLFYLFFTTVIFLFSKVIPFDQGKYTIAFFLSKFIYAAIPAAIIASMLNAYRNLKWNEQFIAQLKLENRKSELQGLKEQLSPHFFFNTLNTLSGIIRTGDKSESIDFVDNLSDVYRYILDSKTNDTVKLSDEIAFVKSYLYLLKKRFGNNIDININLNSEIVNKYIPPLSLQILIENAVKHNVFSDTQPLVISIEQKASAIIIRNNIHPKAHTGGHGIGLANLNKRLLLINNREITIHTDQHYFSVTIPILL